MSIKKINIGTVLVSLLFAVVGALLAYGFMDYPLTYTDFIAGNITRAGEGKSKDVSLVFAFIVVLSLSLVSLVQFQNWIHRKYNESIVQDFSITLMYVSIPFVTWLGGQFLSKGIPNYQLLFFHVWIVLGGLIATFLVLRVGSQLHKNNETSKLIVFSFVIFSFATLSPDVLGIIAMRFGGGEGVLRDVLSNAFYVVPAVWLIFLYIFNDKRRYYKYSVIFFQTVIIGYFVLLLPSPYITEGQIAFFPTQTLLYVIVSILVVYSVFDIYKRFKLTKDTDELPFSLLSPFPLVALFILIFLSATSMPNVSTDDYHFGEKLLPFYMIVKYHITPFADYAMAHGFVDLIPSIGSSLFFDGTASTLGEGSRILKAFLVILSFMIAYRYVGLLTATLLITLLLPIGIWYFIAASMSLIIMNIRVERLGVSFFLISLISFLLAPGQGAIFIIAMLPLVFYRVWNSKTIILNLKATGIAFVVLIVSALLMPWILDMIFSAVRYVLENGPVNFQAYGIAWHHSWNTSQTINSSLAIYEVIRASWIFVPIFILSFWLLEYYKGKKEAFFYGLFALVFVLIMHKYSLGRIDPFGLSRLGIVSKAGIPLLFLSVYFLHFPKRKRAYFALFFVFWMGLLTPDYLHSPIIQAKRGIPNIGTLTKGEEIGIPKLGNGRTNTIHMSRTLAIKKIADQFLDDNETFVDITNRGGLYFYLDRRMPIEAVPYNQPHPSMQKRSIGRLSANPPPMALLKAESINHDGYPVSLRAYHLYRWVMDNYIPVLINDIIIGVHKDKMERFKQRFPDTDYAEVPGLIHNFTDVNWLNGISRWGTVILVLNNPRNNKIYKVNNRINLINGDIRTISNIIVTGEYIQVHLSGNKIENINSSDIEILIGSKVVISKTLEERMKLWDKVFLLRDLQQLPISWGISQKTLNDRMSNIKGINFTATRLHEAKTIESGKYQVTGNDPFIVYDISQQAISGSDAGILSFDFSCDKENTKPRMQVFWSADDYGITEKTFVHFNAHNGHVIVPLDAMPRWISAGQIKQVRIDLQNHTDCNVFSIENLKISQRILDVK